MAELLLLNPRKRRATKKRRSAKRRMTAKQAMYFGKRRAARKPRVTVRRRSRRTVTVMANPRRRRRAMRSNPIYRRRSVRRNPSMRLSLGSIKSTVIDAGKGAVGAVVVDVAMGQIAPRLPASLVTPNVYPFVKGGVAILLGALGSKVLGPTAAKMAEGSLICTLHEVLRSYVAGVMPLGYVNSAPIVRGGRGMNGMGAFLSGGRDRHLLAGLGQNGEQTPMEREMYDYGPGYAALNGMGAFLSR